MHRKELYHGVSVHEKSFRYCALIELSDVFEWKHCQ